MLPLLNTFNMAIKLFLFSLSALYSVSVSTVVQYPALVKVFRGETVSLMCDTMDVLSKCDSVFWSKVQPRTKEMMVTSTIHSDQTRKLCTGFIYNTSVADSGIYYCAVKHSFITYWGTGSTVIVTERRPRPSVTLYVPDVRNGPSAVSLQCVVMGVVPSEVNVSWVIGESKMTGWTESSWTHTGDLGVEYTRAHVSIPWETWVQARSVECVVEVDGGRVSKSFHRGSSHLCSWLMYLCSGVALVIVLVFIITFMYLQRARQCCVPKRPVESLFSRRNGGKRRTERSSMPDVQYASLDLNTDGQRGSTTLTRNVLLKE